jgi:hypothetical protein
MGQASPPTAQRHCAECAGRNPSSSLRLSCFPQNATAPTESLQAVEHLPAFRLPQAHLVEFTA